jgi:hypothetical protein
LFSLFKWDLWEEISSEIRVFFLLIKKEVKGDLGSWDVENEV